MSKTLLDVEVLEAQAVLELPDRELLGGGSLIDADIDLDLKCVTVIVIGDDKAC